MLHVEFCSARSYGAKTETSGSVQISYDDSMVKGRNVLVSSCPACVQGLLLPCLSPLLCAAAMHSQQHHGVRAVRVHQQQQTCYEPPLPLPGGHCHTHDRLRPHLTTSPYHPPTPLSCPSAGG